MMTWADVSDRLQRFRAIEMRERIALLYGGLFAVVLLAIMVLVSMGIERFGEDNATRELTSDARIIDEILELRASQLHGAAKVLSRDFGFREAVATDDSPTVASALNSLRSRSNATNALVIGYDGSVVSDGLTAVPSSQDIWTALDEGRDYGIVILNGRPALAAASPIEAPNLLGWLVLAQSLTDQEMARLEALSAARIKSQVVARSMLPEAFANAPLGRVFENNGDTLTLNYLSELPTLQAGLEPRLVLRHSLETTLREYNQLYFILLVVSGCGLALAVILGNRIAHAINNAIGERERQIVHAGQHDGLTQLPNRRYFIEQLDAALARRGGNDRVMVAYCDLDNFKTINDTFGHPAGDALLCAVADGLREAVPDGVVARLGGDEFAIMQVARNADTDFEAVGQRIHGALVRLIDVLGREIQNSGSLGIAVAPHDGITSVELMKNADLALYQAKADGRSVIRFYDSSLGEVARHALMLKEDLKSAISSNQLELHYQPIFSLPDRKLEGFEALVRWNHPTEGRISPKEFIPLAEETGLIIPIGDWILREACHQAASWADDLWVAVNISPRQFGSADFSTTVVQTCAASGLPPHRLELEITESIFIKNVENTCATLHSLRALGVRIVLDDFGTGYSSLSYLRRFPFDKVKIDRSFVNNLENGGPEARALIGAITSLADAIGMETLAEGIENEDQLEILHAEGCRQGQGFLMGQPMTADELGAWLGSKPTACDRHSPHSRIA